MNPKPFSSENHFTAPVAICVPPLRRVLRTRRSFYGNWRALHEVRPSKNAQLSRTVAVPGDSATVVSEVAHLVSAAALSSHGPLNPERPNEAGMTEQDEPRRLTGEAAWKAHLNDVDKRNADAKR